MKATKCSQQQPRQQPLKEVVKMNGKINNGYIEVKNGKTTEHLTKNGVTVELSVPEIKNTYVNDSVHIMTAANGGGSYGISNGRNGCVHVVRHRSPWKSNK